MVAVGAIIKHGSIMIIKSRYKFKKYAGDWDIGY